MKIQFASGRETLCAVNLSVGITTGTIPTGTYYFWLQGRNDVGYNLPSPVASISITLGQSIKITIPEQAYLERENWHNYVVLFNTIDDAFTASALLNYEFSNNSITLPYEVELFSDSHIEVEQQLVAFPTTDLVDGQIITKTTDGFNYFYSGFSSTWKRFYDDYNTGALTTTDDITLGCDVSLAELESSRYILNFEYALDSTDGPSRRYWIFNNFSDDIEIDRQVGLTTLIQEEDVSSLFYGLFKVVFEGYFDRNTNTYKTTKTDLTQFTYLDTEYDYVANNENLVLEENLTENQAFQIRIFPKFNLQNLGVAVNLLEVAASINVVPFMYPVQGTPTDLGEFLGDAILGNDPNLRRVYPSSGLTAVVDTGISLVNNLLKRTKSQSTALGFLSNQAEQKLAINSSGIVYPVTNALRVNERLRALVSTAAGISSASSFSNQIQGSANPNISITVDYPSEIRLTYDDVIAGSNKGVFNAEEVVAFIRKRSTLDGAIVETRIFEGLTPTNTTADTFTFLYEDGVVYADPIPSVDFSFWTAPLLADNKIVIDNAIPAAYYDIAIAFKYNGFSITDISHRVADGCIYEFINNLAQIGEAYSGSIYWRSPVSNRVSLSSIGGSQLLDRAIYPVVSAESGLPALYMYLEAETATVDGDQYLEVLNGSGRFVKISGGGGSSTTPTNAVADVSGEALTDVSGEILIFN